MLGLNELAAGAISSIREETTTTALQASQVGLEFAWSVPVVNMQITQVGLEVVFENGPAMHITQIGIEYAFVNPVIATKSGPMITMIS